MSYLIRPFVPDDYEALARTGSVALDYPLDAGEMRFHDAHRDPKCKHTRWSVEADGQLVGGGEYAHDVGHYHPHKFTLDGWLLPAYQGQGIGAALYDTIMATLEPLQPLSVATQVREDMPRPNRFLLERGFREVMRTWQSTLDLTGFDPTHYAQAGEALRRQGITVTTLADLRSDPALERKLYDVRMTTRQDTPSSEPITPVDYDTWVEQFRSQPNILPEGYMVAVQGDRYVGISSLWPMGEDETRLETGFTGVRRECRNLGVALALKVRALTWAKRQGYTQVETFNATTNGPMLHINERLGFKRKPAWIDYIKVLRTE